MEGRSWIFWKVSVVVLKSVRRDFPGGPVVRALQPVRLSGHSQHQPQTCK